MRLVAGFTAIQPVLLPKGLVMLVIAFVAPLITDTISLLAT